MRNYVFDFNTVALLATLEISVFKAIPDTEEVSINLSKLRREVCGAIEKEDDEELHKSFDAMESILCDVNSDQIYYKLHVFQPVVDIKWEGENHEGSEEHRNTENYV